MNRQMPSGITHPLGEMDLSLYGDMAEYDRQEFSEWHDAFVKLQDLGFVLNTMAGAFHAGATTLDRYMHNDPAVRDLPVGAAVNVQTENIIVTGAAEDKETGDPKRHAELVNLDNLKALGITARGLTMAVSLEPCPPCLEEVAESGQISRLYYAVTRKEAEGLGLLRPHPETVNDILRRRRAETGSLGLKVSHFPYPRFQNAFLDLLMPFSRDYTTGEVTFHAERAASSRTAVYLRDLKDAESSLAAWLEPDPEHPGQRLSRLTRAFMSVVAHS